MKEASKAVAQRGIQWAMKDHVFYRLCAAATVRVDALLPRDLLPPHLSSPPQWERAPLRQRLATAALPHTAEIVCTSAKVCCLQLDATHTLLAVLQLAGAGQRLPATAPAAAASSLLRTAAKLTFWGLASQAAAQLLAGQLPAVQPRAAWLVTCPLWPPPVRWLPGVAAADCPSVLPEPGFTAVLPQQAARPQRPEPGRVTADTVA